MAKIIFSAAILSCFLLAGCAATPGKSDQPGIKRDTAATNSADVTITMSRVEDQVGYRAKRDRCLSTGRALTQHKTIDKKTIDQITDDCYSAVGAACTLWNISSAEKYKAINEKHASN